MAKQHGGKQLRNDPEWQMLNTVQGSRIPEVVFDRLDLSRIDREQLPRYIDELRKGEAEVRRLRYRLEAFLDDSERHCPVCDTAVTGRADQVYCGATCRQRARRAVVTSPHFDDFQPEMVPRVTTAGPAS